MCDASEAGPNQFLWICILIGVSLGFMCWLCIRLSLCLFPQRLSHKQDLEARLPPMHVELLLQAGTRITKNILWRFELELMRAVGNIPWTTEKRRF